MEGALFYNVFLTTISKKILCPVSIEKHIRLTALFYTGDTGNNMSTLKRHLLVQNIDISPPSGEVWYLVKVCFGNNVSILVCVCGL